MSEYPSSLKYVLLMAAVYVPFGCFCQSVTTPSKASRCQTTCPVWSTIRGPAIGCPEPAPLEDEEPERMPWSSAIIVNPGWLPGCSVTVKAGRVLGRAPVRKLTGSLSTPVPPALIARSCRV